MGYSIKYVNTGPTTLGPCQFQAGVVLFQVVTLFRAFSKKGLVKCTVLRMPIHIVNIVLDCRYVKLYRPCNAGADIANIGDM